MFKCFDSIDLLKIAQSQTRKNVPSTGSNLQTILSNFLFRFHFNNKFYLLVKIQCE